MSASPTFFLKNDAPAAFGAFGDNSRTVSPLPLSNAFASGRPEAGIMPFTFFPEESMQRYSKSIRKS